MEMEGKKNDDFFIYMLLAGILIVVVNSFYMYFYKQNYPFIVETKCDPEVETCSYRDCENEPDICPPNGLSYYKEYTINARDYKYCENEDCELACKEGVINCVEN